MHFKRFEDQLTQLVAQPSVSSAKAELDQSNLAVLELLASWLQAVGFTADIQPVSDWPGKYNLIAVKGQGPGGLVLAGHSDTVPFDANLWQQNPFQLVNRDNRFYGLGATDMKGFFPVVLAALEKYRQTAFQQPVIVVATADEESSMCGARALAAGGAPKARYAVIGEPTGLRPIRMHKGIIFESICVEGRSGHSSNPALGANAMEVMAKVLHELMALRYELQQRYQHPGFAVPTPTLNLGCIHGGDSPNRICGRCELHIDLRLIPGMHTQEIRQMIHQRLFPVAEGTGTSLVFHSLFPGIEPFETAAGSAIVQAAEALSGHSAESVAFATEAPFLQALGMDTIVMGPGSIDQAHQPNEFIAHEQIAPAVRIIEQLIERFAL